MIAVDQWAVWLPELLKGLWLSIQLAVISLAIGLPGGCLLALAVIGKSRILRIAALVVVEVGRGSPALIVLYFVYYGLPGIGVVLDNFAAAVAAFAFTTAAYTSENFRAGIQAVPIGQLEAAHALGMRYRHWFLDIVLPQGMRSAAPALIGFSVSLFQTTALAFTIALPELLSRAYSIGSSTFQYLDVLTLAGLLYLAVTLPVTWYANRLSAAGGRR
ncbi:MAG: amino acid ABC transporter permease [Mycobacterium sp.]